MRWALPWTMRHPALSLWSFNDLHRPVQVPLNQRQAPRPDVIPLIQGLAVITTTKKNQTRRAVQHRSDLSYQKASPPGMTLLGQNLNECDYIPDGYRPNTFVTDALQHSLEWDDCDAVLQNFGSIREKPYSEIHGHAELRLETRAMTDFPGTEHWSSENGLLFWTGLDHYAELKDWVIGTWMMAMFFFLLFLSSYELDIRPILLIETG